MNGLVSILTMAGVVIAMIGQTAAMMVLIRKNGLAAGALSQSVSNLTVEVGYLREWREETTTWRVEITSLLSRTAEIVRSMEHRVNRLEDKD